MKRGASLCGSQPGVFDGGKFAGAEPREGGMSPATAQRLQPYYVGLSDTIVAVRFVLAPGLHHNTHAPGP